MDFDWYLEMEQRVSGIMQDIMKLDQDIKKTIDKNQKKKLRDTRDKKWNDFQKEIKNMAPFLGSQFALTTSSYFLDSSSEYIFREYYQNIIHRNGKRIIREYYESQNELNNILASFRNPKVNIAILPACSSFLQLSFTLAQPYISRNDESFYLNDNPVKKDKVFQVPMVSASTWKGNMRWSARQVKGIHPDTPDDKIITHLFGNEKSEKNNSSRGRLNFYPTFFDEIGLEVINPHSRDTKAGTQPISIECVPEGATGIFSLLYVPFNLMGRLDKDRRKLVNADVLLVLETIKAMMITYGFSAKRTSGYGIIKPEITGSFKFRDKNEIVHTDWKDESLDAAFLKIRKVLKSEGGDHESA